MLSMLASERARADRDRGSSTTGNSPGNVRDILNAGGTSAFMMPKASEDLAQQRQTLRAAVQMRTHAAYEQMRTHFFMGPSLCDPPEELSKKLFLLLLKKEQALCELWFGGQGNGFLPLLFPINIGTDEIGNWGQAEMVHRSQRPSMLKNMRLRRHAALL